MTNECPTRRDEGSGAPTGAVRSKVDGELLGVRYALLMIVAAVALAAARSL